MELDITKFCSAKGRPLDKPFIFQAFTFATNGHFLLRVPHQDCFEQYTGDAKRFSEVVSDIDLQVDFCRLPASLSRMKLEPCMVCNGSGRIVLCVECEGEGSVECSECGHECDCERCDGSGYLYTDEKNEASIVCERCNGCGKTLSHKFAALNAESVYTSSYLLMLKNLPNVMVSPRGDNPMVFKFDGGMGLLMPVRKDLISSDDTVKLYEEDEEDEADAA